MRRLLFCFMFLLGIDGAVAGLPPLSLEAIPVCYNFGCDIRQTISISLTDWRGAAGWLQPPAATPEIERERIRQAIGWMEVLVGRRTPTNLDKARNELLPADSPGQQDCIDESLNTTTYLRLLEKYGLLKWHRVLDRAYRKAILDQHWAAQIEDLTTGERYVVDSWFSDNGSLPFIQKTAKWTKIRYFGTSFDSTF